MLIERETAFLDELFGCDRKGSDFFCQGNPNCIGYSSFLPILYNILSEIKYLHMIKNCKTQFKGGGNNSPA